MPAQLSVTTNVSLDGVTQGFGSPDEDTRGGFDLGGWGAPYTDPVMSERMGEGMGGTTAMLFGRVTYDRFAAYWPTQPDSPFTQYMTPVTKYVLSTTLAEPLPWENSVLLRDLEAVRRVKAERDGAIGVVGSVALTRSLVAAGLVDTWTVLVHPLVLGRGRRLFDGDWDVHRLDPVDSVTTSTGVTMLTYRPVREG